MTMKLIGLAALSATLAAAPAFAQTPTAAAPAQPTHGPVIPGLCALSQEGAVANSAVGKVFRERMLQLEAQVGAELTSVGETLEKDVQAFQTTRATLSEAAVTQRGTELQERVNRFQQLRQTKDAQLSATQSKALGRISDEIKPVVTQTYQARNCSILIDDGAILAGSPSMDITAEVIRGLDARLTTLQIDLEPAPLVPTAAAAPAPVPARAPAAAAPRR